MPEELKELIEKINQEGVQAANNRAQKIEEEAKKSAQAIIEKATKDAEKSLADAKNRIAKMEESGKTSLAQAGRDIVLALRKEIQAILDRVVSLHIRETLSPQELAKILTALIKDTSNKEKGDVVVSLSEKDLRAVEKTFLSALKAEAEKGIMLRPSEDISGGFIISYDSGKSHYDFTDKALAGYMTTYLNPKLREILNEAVSGPEKKKK